MKATKQKKTVPKLKSKRAHSTTPCRTIDGCNLNLFIHASLSELARGDCDTHCNVSKVEGCPPAILGRRGAIPKPERPEIQAKIVDFVLALHFGCSVAAGQAEGVLSRALDCQPCLVTLMDLTRSTRGRGFFNNSNAIRATVGCCLLVCLLDWSWTSVVRQTRLPCSEHTATRPARPVKLKLVER